MLFSSRLFRCAEKCTEITFALNARRSWPNLWVSTKPLIQGWCGIYDNASLLVLWSAWLSFFRPAHGKLGGGFGTCWKKSLLIVDFGRWWLHQNEHLICAWAYLHIPVEFGDSSIAVLILQLAKDERSADPTKVRSFEVSSLAMLLAKDCGCLMFMWC